MSEDRELIWVTKEQATQFKELDTVESQAIMATEIIAKKKLDISSELDQLDDDLIRFKAACLVHKSEMGKVYEEQEGKIQSLINEMWDVMPSAKVAAKKLADQIQPLGDQVASLESSISKVKSDLSTLDIYGMEKLIELAGKLTQMDAATKDIFKFLAANYNREQS